MKVLILNLSGLFFCLGILAGPVPANPQKIATLEEALNSKVDLWGISAMQQTNGPSYEFFAKLLPPLRYVNARFRHYPIVLCAPGSLQKARLISNGSAVNALAACSQWEEVGTPVSFFVGAKQAPFGERLSDLSGPRYERGHLPIVQMDYRSGETTYREETFASIDLTNHAVLFSQFCLKDGRSGTIVARIESSGPLHARDHAIQNAKGLALVFFDHAWHWNAEQKTLTAQLSARGKATLAIATNPIDPATKPLLSASTYSEQRKKCAAKWESLLAQAMRVEVPEPIVNAAWKSTVVGSFMLLRGDHLNYSAGNAYETMYEAESGDDVRALLLWGLSNEARRMIPPLLDYGNNPGLRFHDAAFKLQLLAHNYWLTRDAQFVREQKPRWLRFIEILSRERDATTGLLPRESYCGDEKQKVFSLNSNANTWRGLRDMAVVLQEIGEADEAKRIMGTADTLRGATLAAVEKSEWRDVQPPFLPIALFGEEKPYDVLTATRRGSYWNLMIPYVIGSGIFSGTDRESSMLRYLEQHGGICMGMIRFHQHSRLFANEDGLDDLYGLRYVDALMRRDETEPAIAAFYGKLAQGMTHDTFLSAEGTGLRPLDNLGRGMYLPPTCSGDALFLRQLRSMLVQDYDLNNDGKPETLRLCFATPPRWLEDGKTISVEQAPTSFGKVSLRIKSKLAQGEVIADLSLPVLAPAKLTLLRIRLPDGWKIDSAQARMAKLKVDEKGTVDISGLRGENTIRFKVRKV